MPRLFTRFAQVSRNLTLFRKYYSNQQRDSKCSNNAFDASKFKYLVACAVGGSTVWFILRSKSLSLSNQIFCKESKQTSYSSAYDFVVVGAGLCGISSVYGILSVRPSAQILLVEKDELTFDKNLLTPTHEIQEYQAVYGQLKGRRNIDVVEGKLAVKIDPETKTVTLQGNVPVQYQEACLLATGREVASPYPISSPPPRSFPALTLASTSTRGFGQPPQPHYPPHPPPHPDQLPSRSSSSRNPLLFATCPPAPHHPLQPRSLQLPPAHTFAPARAIARIIRR
jgi:hypothetical protein